jgi:CTP-dependent riboflavin kinase
MFPATIHPGGDLVVVIIAPQHHEIAATVRLRASYGLQNGDVVTLDIDDDLIL